MKPFFPKEKTKEAKRQQQKRKQCPKKLEVQASNLGMEADRQCDEVPKARSPVLKKSQTARRAREWRSGGGFLGVYSLIAILSPTPELGDTVIR